ncbi:MAG TPA: MerR family transcriptional regulator [Solirubrobacteraceae bacterium]|jgi:DNA-binding transcriptional MerR regulator|nr:MerR family transcriptional regulator [Solirubrobacteraceae bacterium]
MSVQTATEPPALRIGDVAKLTGTTARTLRYYEEIGLLPGAEDREAGRHRSYTQADVDRVREVLRLRDLLGVSLDELRELLAAEDARAALREEFHRTEEPAVRRRILEVALGHLDRQLDLVQHRRAELDRLKRELTATRRRAERRLEELG